MKWCCFIELAQPSTWYHHCLWFALIDFKSRDISIIFQTLHKSWYWSEQMSYEKQDVVRKEGDFMSSSTTILNPFDQDILSYYLCKMLNAESKEDRGKRIALPHSSFYIEELRAMPINSYFGFRFFSLRLCGRINANRWLILVWSQVNAGPVLPHSSWVCMCLLPLKGMCEHCSVQPHNVLAYVANAVFVLRCPP